MKNLSYDYRDKINQIFLLRKKNNQFYSLRAFGRDMGVHPSTLSLILNKKRNLPMHCLDRVLHVLDLSPVEETLFRESFKGRHSRIDKISIDQEYYNRLVLDESYFEIIAQWEHYALISLIETDDFRYDMAWVAKRLGIKVQRAEVVLKNLIDAELVHEKDNQLFLSKGQLRTTSDVSSRALRRAHKENCDLAKEKIENVDLKWRDFSSLTIPVDPQKIEEAKAVIREFRQKMDSLLKTGELKEVYNIVIQMYPLTNLKNLKESR